MQQASISRHKKIHALLGGRRDDDFVGAAGSHGVWDRLHPAREMTKNLNGPFSRHTELRRKVVQSLRQDDATYQDRVALPVQPVNQVPLVLRPKNGAQNDVRVQEESHFFP